MGSGMMVGWMSDRASADALVKVHVAVMLLGFSSAYLPPTPVPSPRGGGGLVLRGVGRFRNVLHAARAVLASVFVVAFGILLLGVSGADNALAQACSSDAQCGPSAGGYNVCLGDTLIMRRRICVGGQCLEQETGRMNCGGGSIGGTCQGNTYVAGGSRCDAMSGRCAQGSAIRQTCTKSCSCVGRTLVISTGSCSPGLGCIRTSLRCKVGCTCSGEPRCTEEPTKAPQRGVTPDGARAATAKPASKVNALPPRMAEPFDPKQPSAAVVAPPAPVVKKTRIKNKKKRYRRSR